MDIHPQKIKPFQRKIRSFYRRSGRDFPWRHVRDPYAILVSEIMLQQTQTERVLPKYRAFLKRFPNLKALACADIADVVIAWQGLGYNRRALALKACAEVICTEHNGAVPSTIAALVSLPGVGPYTAAAVTVFAFEKPATFIETNIRSVYLHEFFQGKNSVSDAELLSLIESTLPKRALRAWYYGLMDYGVMLKRKYPGINRRSAHYNMQSKFKGSNRERRGKILRLLSAGAITIPALEKQLGEGARAVCDCLHSLELEGFVARSGKRVWLACSRAGQIR